MQIYNLKTKNFDSEKGIYIGRQNLFYGFPNSKWSNPYIIDKDGDRETVLKLYEEYIKNNSVLYSSLDELIGKDLYCYCFPKKCHGNILLELLNEKILNDMLK